MKKESLFELIQSMSKAEKRYFKLFATRSTQEEKNNYLKLYEQILRQKQYDEKELKSELKNDLIIRNFSVEKKQLYTLLLKSLSDFRANKTITNKLLNTTRNIEVLIEKKLFEQASSLLSETQKKAKELNIHHIILDLSRLELRLSTQRIEAGETSSDNEKTQNDIQETLSTLANLYQHQALRHKTFSKIYGDQYDIAELKLLLNSPLLKTEDNALSIEAKIWHNDIKGIIYRLLENRPLIYEHFKRALALIEQAPTYTEENPSWYLNTLSNYMTSCIWLTKKETFSSALEQLNTFLQQVTNKAIQVRGFAIRCTSESMFYHSIFDFDKLETNAFKTEKEFPNYLAEMPIIQRQTIAFNLASDFILTANADKAVPWINLLLNEEPVNRNELNISIRLLNLITHYELGHFDLLENLTTTYNRKLLQKNGKFEKQFIALFLAILKNPNSAEVRKEKCEEMATTIQQLSKELNELKIIQKFSFLLWVDSIRIGKTMKETYQLEPNKYSY